jgi:hypothetical protein
VNVESLLRRYRLRHDQGGLLLRGARSLLSLLLVLGGPSASEAGAAANPAAPPPRPAVSPQWARPGAASALAAPCNDLLSDGDFESLNSQWVESSVPVTVTLYPLDFPPWAEFKSPLPIWSCDDDTCAGSAGPAHAAGGSTWAWFGGGITSTTPIDTLVQVISQPVTIKSTPARLEFSVWMSRADPATNSSDWLEVRLGATRLFSVTAAMTPSYSSGYVPVSVDVSSFAGTSTTLTISATTQANQDTPPPIANFNVDDVHVCVPYGIYLPMVER